MERLFPANPSLDLRAQSAKPRSGTIFRRRVQEAMRVARRLAVDSDDVVTLKKLRKQAASMRLKRARTVGP